MGVPIWHLKVHMGVPIYLHASRAKAWNIRIKALGWDLISQASKSNHLAKKNIFWTGFGVDF